MDDVRVPTLQFLRNNIWRSQSPIILKQYLLIYNISTISFNILHPQITENCNVHLNYNEKKKTMWHNLLVKDWQSELYGKPIKYYSEGIDRISLLGVSAILAKFWVKLRVKLKLCSLARKLEFFRNNWWWIPVEMISEWINYCVLLIVLLVFCCCRLSTSSPRKQFRSMKSFDKSSVHVGEYSVP